MDRPDKHHILFSRQTWETYEQGRSLRATRSLIPLIDREAHIELHKAVPILPVLGYYALCAVRKGFHTTHDTYKDIDQLQALIQATNEHPKAHPIEKGLAELANHAIDLQKPFLREGLITQ